MLGDREKLEAAPHGKHSGKKQLLLSWFENQSLGAERCALHDCHSFGCAQRSHKQPLLTARGMSCSLGAVTADRLAALSAPAIASQDRTGGGPSAVARVTTPAAQTRLARLDCTISKTRSLRCNRQTLADAGLTADNLACEVCALRWSLNSCSDKGTGSAKCSCPCTPRIEQVERRWLSGKWPVHRLPFGLQG